MTLQEEGKALKAQMEEALARYGRELIEREHAALVQWAREELARIRGTPPMAL